MNSRVFFWSLTSALAGFLFGFDTVVISGAEKTIQSLWGLSPGLHGIAMASALYGTVVGALVGAGPLTVSAARPRCSGSAFFILSVPSARALATNVVSLFIARVIGGLGIGISTVVAPCTFQKLRLPNTADAWPACFSSTSSSASW
jgi:SP family arabinose:H+ symporter-like MFS transporter